MLTGNLDIATLSEVSGWVQQDDRPELPVSLIVTHNDNFLGRILANRYRGDLEEAGIGDGKHGFEFKFAKRLSPSERHTLRVFKEEDGIDIPGSPITITPSEKLDRASQEALATYLQSFRSEADLRSLVEFLASELDRAIQGLADSASNRQQRREYAQLRHRWSRENASAEAAGSPAPLKRALVIDDRIPVRGRDAGSNAVLSHMQSLQRMGYEVTFIPAIDLNAPPLLRSWLEGQGIACPSAPIYGSVEEVLRRQAGEFDLVYMHRVANAVKYGELVRHYSPKAFRIYSVADLHHIRVQRQIEAEQRTELIPLSQWFRFAEFVAAASAHAVITHSEHEARILSEKIPPEKIHTVLWSAEAKPTKVPFPKRRDIAFIGNFDHEPNRDAARWLIKDIMPLVKARDENIRCLLVGSAMPDDIRGICGNEVLALGYVEDLQEIFDRVRLTVAPLGYGAGIKGKVLDSLSAGVPCVCTPIAAEGLMLPPTLKAYVANDAPSIADHICKLHNDQKANAACRRAGLHLIEQDFSESRLDDAMRRVVMAGGRKAAPSRSTKTKA